MFAAFLGRSPDTATSEDLRRFQLHLAQQQISAGSINAAIAALRFFFTVTLERPDLVRPLRIVNEPRKAPVVLSQEEVARLLEAAPGLKYKAALSVAYGAGLRVSEVANLKVSDIDSRVRLVLFDAITTCLSLTLEKVLLSDVYLVNIDRYRKEICVLLDASLRRHVDNLIVVIRS